MLSHELFANNFFESPNAQEALFCFFHWKVVLMTSIDSTDSFTDEAIASAQKHTNGQILERPLQVHFLLVFLLIVFYF